MPNPTIGLVFDITINHPTLSTLDLPNSHLNLVSLGKVAKGFMFQPMIKIPLIPGCLSKPKAQVDTMIFEILTSNIYSLVMN